MVQVSRIDQMGTSLGSQQAVEITQAGLRRIGPIHERGHVGTDYYTAIMTHLVGSKEGLC